MWDSARSGQVTSVHVVYADCYLLKGEVSLFSSESCFDEASPPINSWNPSTFTGGALRTPAFLHTWESSRNSVKHYWNGLSVTLLFFLQIFPYCACIWGICKEAICLNWFPDWGWTFGIVRFDIAGICCCLNIWRFLLFKP